MEKKVLAGSPEDRRWPAPINPDKPQIVKPKPKKTDVLKKVRDENSALKNKLDDITFKNTEIVAENRTLLGKIEKLKAEIKAQNKQLSTVKKEAEDVVKATTKKKSTVPRKNTRKA